MPPKQSTPALSTARQVDSVSRCIFPASVEHVPFPLPPGFPELYGQQVTRLQQAANFIWRKAAAPS